MISAIIPARGGSKSIPHKNIADVGGFPLIAYSIAACKLSNNIDRVIVSTEDEKIADISEKYGAEVPFLRPEEHSRDDSTDVGFLTHFFNNVDVDQVALIRPTTPFRNPEYMDEVINIYFEVKNNITGLRTVEEINENPYKVYKMENNICGGFFDNFEGNKDYTNLPRQTFPTAFVGNGHIDIVKKETVMKNTTFGGKVYGCVCDNMVDIDSPFDLKIARIEIKSGNQLLEFLKENSDG
jgi:CMP-N,N'-diacetyllegionaminic acid synthase